MKNLNTFLSFFSFFFLFRATEIYFLSNFFTDIQITSRVLNIGNPSSSLSENGFFIIVWALHQTNPNESGIFGQIYNKDGSPYESQMKISTSNYILDNPSVALQNDGIILVIWSSLEQDGDGSGIYSNQ